MKKYLLSLLLSAAITACGQSPSTNGVEDHSPLASSNSVVARATDRLCEIQAPTLSAAREEFVRFCGQPPRDCDPRAGDWVCSSGIIGNNAPALLTACSTTGATFSAASEKYAASCTLPRRDCDPLGTGWLCSSEQIGDSAPAFSVAVFNPGSAPAVDFLKNLSLAEQWNELALAAVRAGKAKPTVTAHQLFMLSAAMYDAYAIYDDVAIPYALDATLRSPAGQRTLSNRQKAVSQAAYQMLVMMYPEFEKQNGFFLQHLRASGYRAVNRASATPAGQGYAAARAVVAERRDDSSNYQNGYADTLSLYYPEKYQPVNLPGAIVVVPNRWQPLRVPNGTVLDGLSQPVIDDLNLDSFGDQQFLTPHWGAVTPFSMSFGAEFRPVAPPLFGSDSPYVDGNGVESSNHEAYLRQVGQVVEFSANLSEKQKVIAEFWADGPRTESPPGHWNQLAHGIIERDALGLGESVKLFFTLNAALLDASIATWEAKRYYDYIRPASAIRFLFEGKLIEAWGGPNLGTQLIKGDDWSPYQSLTFVTPPFPEYVSGHSTFSRASAEVLRLMTGSDRFYDGVTRTAQDVNGDGELDILGEHIAPAGSFLIEQGPAEDIVLRWHTFLEAADEAGQSRLFGGIHIQDGDLRGRELGAKVGKRVFDTAQQYFNGSYTR